MSSESFALLLGVKASTVNQWLYGEFSPTLDRFKEIVTALSDAKPGEDAYRQMASELFADAPRGRRLDRKAGVGVRLCPKSN